MADLEDLGKQGNVENKGTVGREQIRVSCPECLKKFSIRTAEIAERHPKFKCTACQSVFWISYPECLQSSEVIGFPVEWLTPSELDNAPQNNLQAEVDHALPEADFQSSENLEHKGDLAGSGTVNARVDVPSSLLRKSLTREYECPKCLHSNPAGANECQRCGVIFQRLVEMPKSARVPAASKELKALWERVIESYDEEDLHQEFVGACRSENNLEYASSKYGSILEAHGGDEIARNMRDQIIALASTQMAAKPQRFSRVKPRRFSFTTIAMILSVSCMAVGYFIPMLRNLVGVGAAVLFMSLAIKYYFFRES